MSSLHGLLLIICSSYIFWGNIIFSYFTLIELDISELDEPWSYLWFMLILIFFLACSYLFLLPSRYRNTCFLLMMCHMTIRWPNLEDASQSHIINTVVALVSCRGWECVVIVMIKKERTFFHLVTTFTTPWSGQKFFFFI